MKASEHVSRYILLSGKESLKLTMDPEPYMDPGPGLKVVHGPITPIGSMYILQGLY